MARRHPRRERRKNTETESYHGALLLLATVATVGAATTFWVLENPVSAQKKKKALPAIPLLQLDETPDPPLLGFGDCTGLFLAKSSGALSSNVLALMNPAAKAFVTPPNGKRIGVDAYGNVYVFQPGTTRLTPEGQVKVFKSALALLSSPDRSTLSITTRKILKSMMPECNWDVDLWATPGRDSMSKSQYNLWVSAWYLVEAASRQVGYKAGGDYPSKSLMIPYGGGPGLIIGRGFLGLPDVATPGTLALEPGRRIELIGGEHKASEMPRPPFFHAEPLFARVIDSDGGRPTVEILGDFQGRDVSPRFAHRHGFYVGRRLRLPGTGTTAVRKIYPAGVE